VQKDLALERFRPVWRGAGEGNGGPGPGPSVGWGRELSVVLLAAPRGVASAGDRSVRPVLVFFSY